MIKHIQLLMCSLMVVVINPCLVAMQESVPELAPVRATCRVSKAKPIHVIPIPELLGVNKNRYVCGVLALKNGNIAVRYPRGIALFDASNGYACVQAVKRKNRLSLVEVDGGRVAFKEDGEQKLRIFGDKKRIDLPAGKDWNVMLFLGNANVVLTSMWGNFIKVNIHDGTVVEHQLEKALSPIWMTADSADTFMVGVASGSNDKFVIMNHNFEVKQEGDFNDPVFIGKKFIVDCSRDDEDESVDEDLYMGLKKLFFIYEQNKACGPCVDGKFLIFDSKTFAVTEFFEMNRLSLVDVNDQGLVAYAEPHMNVYKNISIRNLAKLEEETVISLEGLEFTATSIAVSGDSKLIVGCSDGVVRVWDLKAE